ncbi:alcohol dehydrogenase [Aliidiomarina minuta]|uniref:Alcohol dehydrogenase n=1 Tax=Aliidiomarina minuta TaxID=880057 RepID=A0A432W3Y3_9GAMM|nr:iron-containing alcohol dehydrogenase [Aliidiomarina minuta]RUO24042.1 alcohol dehydrogenase [Aliidiomarina minuta]
MSIATFKSAHRLITGAQSSQQTATELAKLGVSNPFIVTDKGVRQSGTLDLITAQFKHNVTIYDEVPAEPEVSVVEHCAEAFNQGKHDGVLAVGGGSAMDIAKVIAVFAGQNKPLLEFFGENNAPTRKLPLITLPTTAGTGSEVTNIAILADTENQIKKGIVSDQLLPDVAIVSPEMTLSCPRSVTAASGVDALVHAIEAYLSNFASPVTDALAIKAMSMIRVALPKVVANPHHLQAREEMATGSLLAGLAFGNAGVGAVHALAYPLGGRYHMAHGVSNALMLPYVMEWNKLACAQRFVDIASALGLYIEAKTENQIASEVVSYLHQLCSDVGIPQGLRSFDIPRSAIPELAAEAIKVERLLRNNPRVLSQSDIEKIYQAAY